MNLNTKDYAHMGVEAVVIGGLGFWLNKQIKSVQEENKLLSEKITKLQEALGQHANIIRQQDAILRQRFPDYYQQNPNQKRQIQGEQEEPGQQKTKTKKEESKDTPKEKEKTKEQNKQTAREKEKERKEKKKPPPKKADESDMDDYIASDLEKLEESRKK